MGRTGITLIGKPLKEPKIGTNGVVELLFKLSMDSPFAAGLSPLGESNYKVFITPRMWAKLAPAVKNDSKYFITGEPKAAVSTNGTLFIKINATQVLLRKDKKLKAEKSALGLESFVQNPGLHSGLSPVTGLTKNNQEKWFNRNDVANRLIDISVSNIKLIEDVHKGGYRIMYPPISILREMSPVAVRLLGEGEYGLVAGHVSYMNAKVFDIPTLKAFVWEGTREEFFAEYKIKEKQKW